MIVTSQTSFKHSALLIMKEMVKMQIWGEALESEKPENGEGVKLEGFRENLPGEYPLSCGMPFLGN